MSNKIEHGFKVGDEVKQTFIELSPRLSPYFIKNNFGKLQADLSGIAKYLLTKLGVSLISHTNECTFTEENKYYSYRRSGKTGRMASVICLSE